MAFFEMKYYSDALGTGVSVNVVLPENATSMIGMEAKSGKTFKTVYLFHGLSDDHSIWHRRTSIERYATEMGVAVVMPNAGRSWYTDTAYGARYFTFVTEELPRICRSFFRGMTDQREDNFVAGLSMGGYGAVKAALSCPEKFGGCAALSGAYDVAELSNSIIAGEWKSIFGWDLSSPEEIRGSKHDVYALARKNKEEGKPFPKLYMWCGQQDFLLEHSRRLHSLLDELKVEHIYEETAGSHAWKCWDDKIQTALRFLLSK